MTPSQNNWLDIGCGRTSGMNLFSQTGVKITVIDNDPAVITIVKKRHPWLNAVCADAQQLPFKTSTFSKVFVSHVLEHVASPRRVLKEARRVLKPHGELMVAVPHPHFEKIVSAAYPKYHSQFFHRRIFTKRLLLALLNRAHFTDCLSIKSQCWFYGICLTLGFYLSQLSGKPLQTYGIVFSPECLGRTIKTVARILDKIPIVNLINTIYPFEIVAWVKK